MLAAAARPETGRARRRRLDRAGHARRDAARRRRPARGGRRGARGRARQRVRDPAPAGPPRRARGRDGLLPVQQHGDRGALGAARARPRAASRSSTGTSTTATGPRRSSSTTRRVLTISLHQDGALSRATPAALESRGGEGRTSTSRCPPGRATTATRTRSSGRRAGRARLRARPDPARRGPGRVGDRPARAHVDHRAGLPRADRPRRRARRRGLRRPARRDARGRLLAACTCRSPTWRSSRASPGWSRASPTTRSASTCRARCATSSARPSPPRSRRAPRLMLHDAHGYWIAEAGSPRGAAAARGRHDRRRRRRRRRLHGHVDGLAPARGRAGRGRRRARGRRAAGTARAGATAASSPASTWRCRRCAPTTARPAAAWVAAARETVDAIGAWCEAEGVDAWYRKGGELVVSTAPAQDGVRRGGGRRAHGDRADAPSRRARAATRRSSAPACSCPHAATVHPARLAFGLRERLLARGARIYEGSRGDRRCGRCRTGSRSAPPRGSVRARDRRLRDLAPRGTLPPLRNRLTVSSSHIVCTEPVPDVSSSSAGRGGEAISDGRALLHYTAHDARRADRVRLGRRADGGRRAAGRRMEVDHGVIAQVKRDLVRFFPQLEGRRDRARLGRADRRLPHAPPGDRRRAGCPPGRRSATRATASARRTCSAARSRRSRSTGATR